MRRLTRPVVLLATLLVFTAPIAVHAQVRSDGQRRVSAVERTPNHRTPFPSGSAALKRFSGCADVHDYLEDVILETLVRQLYWDWWYRVPYAGGPEDDGSSSPTDYTTTNLQEEGVDELDMIKTDGDFLYVADDLAFTIVDSWPPSSASLASRLDLESQPHGLFLLDDRAVVFTDSNGISKFAPEIYRGGTRIDIIDVTDRSRPAVAHSIEVEGWLIDARLIDGHAYVVIQSRMDIPQEAWDLIWDGELDLPELDWSAPDDEREAASREATRILRPYVEEIVAGLEAADVVPMIRSTTDGDWNEPRPLFDCRDLYRPSQLSEYSMLSVLDIDLSDPSSGSPPIDAVGLLADGWTVYASSQNLYVAQSSRWWWGRPWRDMTTTIHKFELAPGRSKSIRYAASGEVTGWLLDQFSISEHDVHLRVATTEFDWWRGVPDAENDPGSVVTVLADDRQGRLIETGRTDGIAPGERIYACRFMGDMGYLVTFVQVDPLFTLDLSDPTAPRLVGELEVPGYSAYLHPMENGFLLAVGMDADDQGRVLGLAVSIFDVRDAATPRLAHRFIVEDEQNTWSWSEALDDHHAFTFHRGVLSIPAYLSEGPVSFSGLIVLSADEERGIWELGRIDHSDLPAGPWGQSARMRRSVYIEDWLYSLSTRGVKVNSLARPDFELAKVPFYEAIPEDGTP